MRFFGCTKIWLKIRVLLKNKVFEKIDIDEFREAIKKMFEFREVLSATIDELRKKTGGGENN